ncbi:MAG: carbohydrate binding domain-containing protein [Phycisphaerales bacterium]
MNNFKIAPIALCAAAAALTGSASASANILTNPGFENTDAWGHIFTLGDLSGYVDGFAHTGTRSFYFSTAADVISLSQAVPFVNGQAYELSFWVYNLGVGNDLLEVSLFASDAPEQIVTTGMVPTELETWQQVTLNFSVPAAGDFYRLEFTGYDNSSAWYIDDVSLTAVPGPGVGVLVGVAGLIGLRRQR